MMSSVLRLGSADGKEIGAPHGGLAQLAGVVTTRRSRSSSPPSAERRLGTPMKPKNGRVEIHTRSSPCRSESLRAELIAEEMEGKRSSALHAPRSWRAPSWQLPRSTAANRMGMLAQRAGNEPGR